VSNVTHEQIAQFVEGRAITPEIEQALRRILAQKAAVANLESQKEARDGDQDKIFDDQQRLRENMKSLKGSAEEKALLQRYTQQLNAQETRLEELRKAMDQLDEEISKAQAALDQMIESLVFDVKL
jgi:septal ring factor EnvC (AmiA/AmiB activator)